ncbi:MAG: TlpA disulfide reductase family protein [Ferruginibacter sp.]
MKNAIIAAIFICSGLVAGAQPRVGDMAPEISLLNKKDSTINLSSFRGKVVLIDFWASWCAPCRQSNPAVVKLYNHYNPRGFSVFGVSIDSKKEAWLQAVAQDNITYTQVIDPAGWSSQTAQKYGVNQIPTSFLLDKTGRIIAVDLEGDNLEDQIKQLL